MYRETVTCPQCKYKSDFSVQAFKNRGMSCCFCKLVLLTKYDIRDLIRLHNLLQGKDVVYGKVKTKSNCAD